MTSPYDRPRRPARRRPLLLFFALPLAVAAGLVLLWFVLDPMGIARLAGSIKGEAPLVKSLAVKVNGQEHELRPGQFFQFHPADSFGVTGFTSNRWYNYDLRLYSPDLDVLKLKNPSPLLDVLGEEAFHEPRQFIIQVKEGPMVLANFYLLVSMTPIDWLSKADKAVSDGEKARYYQLALLLDPKDTAVRDRLSSLLEAMGRYEEAADLREKALGENPDPAELAKLLTIYLAAHDHGKTVGAYERLIKASPPDQSARLLRELLDYHRARQDQEGTVKTYNRLIAASPEPEAAGYLRELAHYYQERGDNEQTVAAYRALKERLTGREAASVLKEIGFLQAQDNKPDEAIKAYEEAAALDPEDANIYHNLARLYQSKGNQERYLKYMAQALNLDPANVEARLKLIDEYLAAGKTDKAENDLKTLLSAEPDNIEARLRLVNLLENKKDYDELSVQYEYLLAKSPENKVLRYNLGVIYFDQGKLDKAEAMMKEVMRLDPKDVEAAQYLFEIYRKQDKKDEALDRAEQLIQLDQSLEAPYDYIFETLDKKGDYESLARRAAKWSSSRPDNLPFREMLAYALIKGNDLKGAVEPMEYLAERRPRDLETHFKLARLYQALGRLDKAKKTYEHILEIDPENQEAAEARLNLAVEGLKGGKPQ